MIKYIADGDKNNLSYLTLKILSGDMLVASSDLES